MRYASIDIGTNTLRLLIADTAGGRMRPVVYKRTITRLGGDYDEAKGISDAAAERTFKALGEFRKIIGEAGATEILATATSVVRRAKNRDLFLSEVLKRTGIVIKVISGDEEARLSLLGVLSVVGGSGGKRVVMDIGGGSTEYIFTNGNEISGAFSMEMGVVHLTERHLKSDPPKKDELASLEVEIKGVLNELKSRMREKGINPEEYSSKNGTVFIGTAGTITTLAALDQNLEVYDRDRINNHTLNRDNVKNMYGYLAALTLKERETVLSLEKGREDLIIPGSAIALLSMAAFGFYEMKVSDAGLLEGIILKELAIKN